MRNISALLIFIGLFLVGFLLAPNTYAQFDCDNRPPECPESQFNECHEIDRQCRTGNCCPEGGCQFPGFCATSLGSTCEGDGDCVTNGTKCLANPEGEGKTCQYPNCNPKIPCPQSFHYCLPTSDGKTLACQPTFTVATSGAGPIPSDVCADKENGRCRSIPTALGIDIGTDPASFIKSVMGLILSLIGGITIILIIISGYRIMTSQGNPDRMKEAREQLTAAILGLLFIIFSILILQLITVDILRIPGFNP